VETPSRIIRPVTFRFARAFVGEHHRHLPAPVGGRFALALYEGARPIGVIIAGRPVARALDDGLTLEVTRCTSTGLPNVCSQLYGRVIRVAQAMGYLRVVTYTRADEPGTSPRAGGFTREADVVAESWSRPSRPRQLDLAPIGKVRWVRYL